MAFEVLKMNYDDLTAEQKSEASNNGCGKEYANYLAIKRGPHFVFLESDAMEPEDAKFSRDLKWIKEALDYAYQCGVSDEKVRAAMQ